MRTVKDEACIGQENFLGFRNSDHLLRPFQTGVKWGCQSLKIQRLLLYTQSVMEAELLSPRK